MKNKFDELKKQGYLILKGYLTEEVILAVDSLKRFMQSQLGEQVSDEFDELVRKIFLGNPQLRQFVYDNARSLAYIQGLFRSSKIFALLKELKVHLPIYTTFPSVRFDLSDEKERIYLRGPHQDLRSIVSEVAYTIWIGLTEISPERGGVALYPGTEKMGLLPHKCYPNNEIDKEIRSDILKEKVVVNNLRVGDIVIFNSLMVHESVCGISNLKCICFQQVSDGAKFNATISDNRNKIPDFKSKLAESQY